MEERDKSAFQETLNELAQVLRASVPLPDAVVRHCWRVCKAFDLHIFRRACNDLIDTQEFFPRPSELKRACEAYEGPGSKAVHYLRCLHVDYSRRDEATREAWRCPSTFPFDGGGLAYCPKHAPLYAHDDETHGPPATPAEISQVFDAALKADPDNSFLQGVVAEHAQRVAAGKHPAVAAWDALGSALAKPIPPAPSLSAAEQLEAATQAGLLPKA